MTSTTFRVLLYALVAATSPLALGATLAVLRSQHARINGLAFAIGFVATQAAVCLLAFAFDAASLAELDDGSHTIGSVLALVFGIALLCAAGYLRKHPGDAHAPGAAVTHRGAGHRHRARVRRSEAPQRDHRGRGDDLVRRPRARP